MKKLDTECARKMAERIIFADNPEVIIDEWETKNLIDTEEERICENCNDYEFKHYGRCRGTDSLKCWQPKKTEKKSCENCGATIISCPYKRTLVVTKYATHCLSWIPKENINEKN